jgi:hypothetical protein
MRAQATPSSTAGHAEARSPPRPASMVRPPPAAVPLSSLVPVPEDGVSDAGAAGPPRAATTTIRWRAEYLGWQAVSVSRSSPKSSSTSTWSGATMSCWRTWYSNAPWVVVTRI